MADVPGGGLHAAAVGAQLLGADGQQRLGRQGIPGGGQGLQHTDRLLLQRRQPLALAQQQPRQVAVLLPGGQQGLGVLPGLPEDVLDPLPQPPGLAQAHQGVGGKVVENRPELCARQQLAGGQQQGGVDIFCPPLGEEVEGPQGVHLVVEELAAHGLLHQGGEHVQDAAPQGELAHALHLLAAGVTRSKEALRQPLQVCPLPDFQRHRQALQQGRRQGPGHEGVGGGHGQGRFSPGQGIQGCQAAPLPVPGGHRPRLKLPLPGQQRHRRNAGQGGQIPRQLTGLPLVAADEHRRAACGPGHGGPHASPVNRLEARHGGGTAPLLHPPDQFRNFRQRL